MNKITIALLAILFGIYANAQAPKNNYEAANWRTWSSYQPNEVSINVPPTATAMKAELAEIKKKLSAVTVEQLANIIYWNAGAPSYRWNQISQALVSWDNPDLVMRVPASWMNIAVYDATVLAWKEKVKHKRTRPFVADATIKPVVAGPSTYSFPCEHTVTASAAAHVLAYFYPKKADSILQLARSASQSRIQAGLQYPSDAEAGWKLGEAVAKNIIEKAKLDGSAAKWDGKMNTDPKKWTGPYPLGITAARFSTLTLRSADQFRPAPPNDFTSEMADLKNFKRTSKTNGIAYFWANSSGNLWGDLAAKKMFENRIMDDAPVAARMFTIMATATHDVGISVMDAKYAYWGIRPSQMDTTYKPLIATPPFPGYPSGHAMGGGALATILSYFFPEDAAYFHKLAQECADSRFYAGIHFKSDNEVGLQMGKQVAAFITDEWMKMSAPGVQARK